MKNNQPSAALCMAFFLLVNCPTTDCNPPGLIPLYEVDEQNTYVSDMPTCYLDAQATQATKSCPSSSPSYQLILPITPGLQGQLLGLADNSGNLTWLSTGTSGPQLQLLATATRCDIPLTLVLRDSTGSFAATTVTLSGNSLINYSTLGGCDTGGGFVFAPTHQNTIIGLGAGASNRLTGTANTVYGYHALQTNTQAAYVFAQTLSAALPFLKSDIFLGLNNVAMGAQALKNTTGIIISYTATGDLLGNLGSDNIGIGKSALEQNVIGIKNVAIGNYALYNSSDVQSLELQNNLISDNVAIGYYACFSNKFGLQNIAIGTSALQSNTSGINNIALGSKDSNNILLSAPLENNTSGSGNIAISGDALSNNITGNNNIALGSGASRFNISGSNNVALGTLTLFSNTAGQDNIAIGYLAGFKSTASNNIYIGSQVQGNTDDTNVISIGIQNSGTTGSYIGGIYPTPLNGLPVVVTADGQLGVSSSSSLLTTATSCDTPSTLVFRDTTGSFAATAITLSGNSLINYNALGGCDLGAGFVWAPTNQNTIIGLGAGNSNANSFRNTVLGFNVLTANTSGNDNVAVGNLALNQSTVSNLTAVGSGALQNNTNGTQNTALGYYALNANTSGENNTALGYYALVNDQTATNCIAVGPNSLTVGSGNADCIAIGANTITSLNNSTNLQRAVAIGSNAMNYGNFDSVAVGHNALSQNGSIASAFYNNNVAVGSYAMSNATGAANSVALGYYALKNTANVTSNNVAVGVNTLSNTNVGSDNTALGANALQAATSNRLTAVGSGALLNNSNGRRNSALGYYALQTLTTGNDNTALGYYAGLNSLGSNNIYVGSNVVGTAGDNNTIRIGIQATQLTTFIAGIAGTTLANQNALVVTNPAGQIASSVPLFNLLNTFSTLTTATSCAVPLTAVLRDTTGSFAATTITLTGNSLINYSTLGGCDTGAAYVFAPVNQNSIIGLNAGGASGIRAGNTALGFNALSLTTTGQLTAIGAGALQNNTSGIQNTAVGFNALATNTTGTSNVAVGFNALSGATASGTGSDCIALGADALINNRGNKTIAIGTGTLPNNSFFGSASDTFCIAIGHNAIGNPGVNGGSNNIAVGSNALFNGNGASNNICIGSNSLLSGTQTTENVAIGHNSTSRNTNGFGNVAVGQNSLGASGSTPLVPIYYNVAVGSFSLFNNSGYYNTAVGGAAGRDNTSSNDNTAVGYNALLTNTAPRLTAVGSGALQANTSGIQNTAIGFNALAANTTGTSNVALGFRTLANNIVGNDNIAEGAFALFNNQASRNIGIGSSALFSNISGSDNTAVGFNALRVTTTARLTAVGSGALQNNTSGIQNTAIGFNALAANTTGTSNVALGFSTLDVNTTGFNNTAVGFHTLGLAVTANDNTAIGANALNVATVGQLTAIGSGALQRNTTGPANTAVGFNALLSCTVGSSHTAVGRQALQNIVFGGNCVAVGNQALQNYYNINSSFASNVAVGSQALLGGAIPNFTGNFNVAVGSFACQNVTTGLGNTAVGHQSINALTTGANNTSLGFQALLTNSTGSNNIAVGANAGSAITTANNVIVIGQGLAGENISNTTYIANTDQALGIGGAPLFVNLLTLRIGQTTSSLRYKKNVQDLNDYSSALYALRPVKFNYIMDNSWGLGLIAEEVAEVYPELVYLDKEGLPMSVHYQHLPILLLNEQQKDHVRIATLEQLCQELQTVNSSLQQQIDALKIMIETLVG